jgi:hypothetical protein
VKAAKTLAAYVMTCPFVATVLPTARPEIGVATFKKNKKKEIVVATWAVVLQLIRWPCCNNGDDDQKLYFTLTYLFTLLILYLYSNCWPNLISSHTPA